MIKMIFQGIIEELDLCFCWNENPTYIKGNSVQMPQLQLKLFSKKQLCLNKHLFEIIELLIITLEDIEIFLRA